MLTNDHLGFINTINCDPYNLLNFGMYSDYVRDQGNDKLADQILFCIKVETLINEIADKWSPPTDPKQFNTEKVKICAGIECTFPQEKSEIIFRLVGNYLCRRNFSNMIRNYVKKHKTVFDCIKRLRFATYGILSDSETRKDCESIINEIVYYLRGEHALALYSVFDLTLGTPYHALVNIIYTSDRYFPNFEEDNFQYSLLKNLFKKLKSA